MAIRFLCPFGHRLLVPDHRAGKKGRCPVCQQRVIVPVLSPKSSRAQGRLAEGGTSEPEADPLPPDDRYPETGLDDQPQAYLGFDNVPGGQVPPPKRMPRHLGIVPDVPPWQRRAPKPVEEVADAVLFERLIDAGELGPSHERPPVRAEMETVSMRAPGAVGQSSRSAAQRVPRDMRPAPPPREPRADPGKKLSGPSPPLDVVGSAALTRPPVPPTLQHVGVAGPDASQAAPPVVWGRPTAPAASPEIAPAASPGQTPDKPAAARVPQPPPLPTAALAGGATHPPRGRDSRTKPADEPKRAWFQPIPVGTSLVGLRPHPDSIQTAYWLAVVLGLVTLFSAAPLVNHIELQMAPAWAQSLAVMAAVQLAYAVWLALLPDAATLRVGMILFAAAAASYALVTAAVLATPPEKQPLLELGELGHTAWIWCAANVVVMALMSFLCGHAGASWRQQ